MRGEYSTRIHVSESSLELPPRARRIPDIAGNRESSFVNYLRVRGEYSPGKTSTPGFVELPPRARRIPFLLLFPRVSPGTTSACAENTCAPRGDVRHLWNYLRVRGEYTRTRWMMCTNRELPPRARRIPERACVSAAPGGTTSACAENTVSERKPANPWRNYLRVRGEYAGTIICFTGSGELPPRARRILDFPRDPVLGLGTTSACAENTPKKSPS